MFRLRKVCAILCSGMCALGSASANPDETDSWKEETTEDVQAIANRNPEAFVNSMNKVLEDKIEACNAAKDKAPVLAPYAPVALGINGRDNALSAAMRGAAEILEDPRVLEYFRTGDLDALKGLAEHYWALALFVHIGLRFVFSSVTFGGVTVGGALLVKQYLKKWVLIAAHNDKRIAAILPWIITGLCSYVLSGSAASVFNVWARKLYGKYDGLEELCKALGNVVKAFKQGLKERNAYVGKGGKKYGNFKTIKDSRDVNQRPVVKGKSGKARLVKSEVLDMGDRNRIEVGNLSESADAVIAAS